MNGTKIVNTEDFIRFGTKNIWYKFTQTIGAINQEYISELAFVKSYSYLYWS